MEAGVFLGREKLACEVKEAYPVPSPTEKSKPASSPERTTEETTNQFAVRESKVRRTR
jgi:hypothetical protein